MKRQISNSSNRCGAALPFLAALIVLAPACRKPATDRDLDAPPSSRTFPADHAAPAPAVALPAPQKPSPPPSPRPSVPDAPTAAELATEASQLVAEFTLPTTDESRRIEIISQLAINGSPIARQQLITIYRQARDLDTRRNVLESLHLTESDEFEPAFVILQDALGRNQDPELRAAAVDALRDFITPQAVGLWRTLLTDPEEDLRNTARDMITFLLGENPAQ